MILEFVLFMYFILAICSILVGIKPDNPYRVDKSSMTLTIVLNIIFGAIFIITLIKQSIISNYPIIINYILMFFILDCILGLYYTIRDYNKESIIVDNIRRLEEIITGIIVVIGILFIWL